MTPPLSDRLKDVQRQYVAMDQHLASIQNAAQGVVHNCAELANKCREEVHVREQVIEGLKYERRMLLSVAVFAGAAQVAVGHLPRNPQLRVECVDRVSGTTRLEPEAKERQHLTATWPNLPPTRVAPSVAANNRDPSIDKTSLVLV